MKTKIAITLDTKTIREVDSMVEKNVFPNRSQAIQKVLDEKIQRLKKTRLARECAKANPAEEMAMAEEGLAEDMKSWPPY